MKELGLGRVVTVLTSPEKTFRSIADRPTWLIAILLLVMLSAVTAVVAAPKIDWQGTLESKLHRAGREGVPAEAKPLIGFMEDHGEGAMLIFHVVSPWLIYPFLAFVFLRIFKAMGSDLSMRTSMGVLVHGLMPWAVATLLYIPLLLRTESLNLYDPGFATPSLLAFADTETSLELWLLLSCIDLFSIWTLVLLVIGYSVATKIDKVRVAASVVGLWAAWIAFMVAMGALT